MSKRKQNALCKLIKTNKDFRNQLNRLYDKLGEVEDTRSDINKKYALQDILFLLVLGLMFGKNDPTNIQRLLSMARIQRTIEKHLKYKGKIPSKQVFLEALHTVPPLSFNAALNEWVKVFSQGPGAQLAFDGKAVRAALAKIEGKNHSDYILNAYIVGTGLFIMQMRVGEKTNEAKTMPKLLSLLELEKSPVTVDAAGTYGEIADGILSSNGHFLLPLKENQPNLLNATKKHFEAAKETDIRIFVDDRMGKKEHGRYERRTYSVISLNALPVLEKYIDNHTSFSKMVGAVCKVVRERYVEKVGADGKRFLEESTQTLYYITSMADITPERFGEYALGHWSVETAHYVLDTVFHEDLSTIRKGHGMENMSLLRKLAYNALVLFRALFPKGCAFQHMRDLLLVNMQDYLFNVFKKGKPAACAPS